MHAGREALLGGDPQEQRRELLALLFVQRRLAILAEVSTLTLVWPAAAWLLPIVRFPAFLWILCAGVMLPKSRQRAA
jgi:hypothetical protein